MRADRMCALAMSCSIAITNQPRAIPKKPIENARPGLCLTNSDTRKHTTAMVHHGKKYSATADNIAIDKTDKKNLIIAILNNNCLPNLNSLFLPYFPLIDHVYPTLSFPCL